tara:strand:- start:476 stop:1255 length:780 start_codon:yes stop_codon:yes gene_type:complete
MIIYIAGYGRSGSTILDYKIGKKINALSLGELNLLNRDFYFYNNSRCSCQEKYSKCKLHEINLKPKRSENLICWKNKILPQTHFLFRYLYYFIWFIKEFKFYNLNSLNEIREDIENIYSIFPNSILIDSSKSTILSSNRPYVLRKIGYKIIIIHIQRSFLSTLSSIKKGDNYFLGGLSKKKRKFRIIRFVFSYFLANYSAKKLKKKFNYLHVRQENLLINEEKTLNLINEFITKNISKDYDKTYEHHIVGGNRLKLKFD